MVGVPGLRVGEDAIAVSLALEVVLGQGRAFVRTVRFLTEQGDPAVEPFLAQGLCCDGAGQATADDDEVGLGCYG